MQTQGKNAQLVSLKNVHTLYQYITNYDYNILFIAQLFYFYMGKGKLNVINIL